MEFARAIVATRQSAVDCCSVRASSLLENELAKKMGNSLSLSLLRARGRGPRLLRRGHKSGSNTPEPATPINFSALLFRRVRHKRRLEERLALGAGLRVCRSAEPTEERRSESKNESAAAAKQGNTR